MPAIEASLGMIAARLDDIAAGVAAEAGQLTQGLRAVSDHSRAITILAADLEQAAQEIDDGLQGQLHVVADARKEFVGNQAALMALAASAEIIASMSARIRDIAVRSRNLSLNARIEAARGTGGSGFAVVAEAMGELAGQTRCVTDDIDGEAEQIERNVALASGIIRAGTDLADHQHAMVGEIATATQRQRHAAGELRRLTAESVEQVDDAAIGIGRVSSAASIVGLLARQIKKLVSQADAERGIRPAAAAIPHA